MTTTDETTGYDQTSTTDWQEDKILVWDEELTLEELKKWYMRQSDYTRKTQELSRAKNQERQQDSDPDMDALDSYIDQKFEKLKQEKWLLTRDEVETEKRFADLIDANPDLRKHEKAIKKIAETENLAFEDVIYQYWFSQPDKLQKAKVWQMKGDNNFEKPSNWIPTNLKEYEKWREKNIGHWDKRQNADSF